MIELLTFSTDDLRPSRDQVLQNQGIPAGVAVPAEIDALCSNAIDLMLEIAAPAGVLLEISKPDFATVYQGQGQNEASTPVGDIFPRAENLALFAATLGQGVSREIKNLFESNDLALAAMFDSAASAAADRLGELAEIRFAEFLDQNGRNTPETCVLRYSPGYCGWHISGQKKLFEFLHPEQIGLTLRDSSLMEPLKSVSGVIIVGPKEIHSFPMSYPFCSQCETRGCRERIRMLSAD